MIDNYALSTTADQIYLEYLMARILQLAETNKILGYQIKQLAEENTIRERQGQEEGKKEKKRKLPFTKLDPKGYCWTHVWRVTKGHISRSCKTKNDGHQYGENGTNTLGGSDKKVIGGQCDG